MCLVSFQTQRRGGGVARSPLRLCVPAVHKIERRTPCPADGGPTERRDPISSGAVGAPRLRRPRLRGLVDFACGPPSTDTRRSRNWGRQPQSRYTISNINRCARLASLQGCQATTGAEGHLGTIRDHVKWDGPKSPCCSPMHNPGNAGDPERRPPQFHQLSPACSRRAARIGWAPAGSSSMSIRKRWAGLRRSQSAGVRYWRWTSCCGRSRRV